MSTRRPLRTKSSIRLKRENWKNGRRVFVTRKANGRFIHIRNVRAYRYRQKTVEKLVHTHRKTEKMSAAQKWAREQLRQELARGKTLSIYGKARVKRRIVSKRWDIAKGSLDGQGWRNAVGEAKHHSPNSKYNFRRSYAEEAIDPENFEGEWVDEPEVESR
jgi:hypothetical protein